MTVSPIHKFRECAETNNFTDIKEIFAPEIVLHSPTTSRPLNGIPMTALCVRAAMGLLHKGDFKVVRTIDGGGSGVMEFQSDIDGKEINGADFLKWNSDGKVVEFKVMVRPQAAANIFCDMMTKKVQSLIMEGDL